MRKYIILLKMLFLSDLKKENDSPIFHLNVCTSYLFIYLFSKSCLVVYTKKVEYLPQQEIASYLGFLLNKFGHYCGVQLFR